MKLIYGTTNKAKIEFMKKHIEPLGIEMLSLNDVNAPKLDIDESGNTPLENAKIKALTYYRELRQPVFSCDSGLYIDGLDEARQPGAHVRSVGGRELDDDGTTAYYSSLAAEFGGSITARYQHAICLVMSDSQVYKHMGEDIASEKFLIVSKPHDKRNEGFPLDRLSVHIESGKYYYDMDESEKKLAECEVGLWHFFKEYCLDKEYRYD
jgi:8-oxo-dGTP diphosphatase